MEKKQLKVVSFNINGMHNSIKKMEDSISIKERQGPNSTETHLDDSEHVKLNKMGYKYVDFSSHSAGRRRAVATLISSAPHYEHIEEHKDKEGSFVLTTGKIYGVLITLINAYAPPGSDWSFYRHIFEMTVTKVQGVFICAGDFNVRLNPNLDSSNGKSNEKHISKRIRNM